MAVAHRAQGSFSVWAHWHQTPKRDPQNLPDAGRGISPQFPATGAVRHRGHSRRQIGVEALRGHEEHGQQVFKIYYLYSGRRLMGPPRDRPFLVLIRAGLKSTADPPSTANTDTNAKKHTGSFSHLKLTIKACNSGDEESSL